MPNDNSNSSNNGNENSNRHVNVTKSFCLCHLLSLWSRVALLGIKLRYYNVSYSEEMQRFVDESRLFVNTMTFFNLICTLFYICTMQLWMYDKMIFLFYVPLYIWLICRRHRLLQLLNICVALYVAMQQMLGELLCMNMQRQCLLCFMLPVQFLLLLIWQFQLYDNFQLFFSLSLACNYNMQLMWLGNYYGWLSCIYVALNTFLRLQLHSKSQLELLPRLLRLHLRLQRLQAELCHFFALHWLSLLALLALRLYQTWEAARQYQANHMQQCNFLWLVWLLLTLLALARELQQQRLQFEINLLKLLIELNQATQLEISSLLVSNFRAPLLLVGSATGYFKLHLPSLCGTLSHIGLLLLLVLCMQLTPNSWHYYNSYNQYDFDLNATKTISEFYRWYSYDEA